MKYGFVVPNNFGVPDPHEVVRLGVRAEELGFDSVWVNHHVLNVGYVRDRLGQRPYHDALIILTWLAAQTSRVNLGTSVLISTRWCWRKNWRHWITCAVAGW